MIESVVLEKLTLSFKNVIIPQQHGSKMTDRYPPIVVLISNIFYAFKNRTQLDCIYLDFSKAFRISHAHLVRKMEALGVSGSMLTWLHSYLIGRTLLVKLASSLTRQIEVTSGVPQRSHLGPFLFRLFVNDIGTDLKENVLLFADDVYRSGVTSTHAKFAT